MVAATTTLGGPAITGGARPRRPLSAREAATRWKPGQSGNPAGRTPGFARLVRERVGLSGEKIVDFLVSVLEGTATGAALATVRVAGEQRPEEVQIGPSIHERIEAAKMLRDSGFGRPALALEVSGPGGGPVRVARLDVGRLSDGELEILEALAEKGAPTLPPAGEVVEGEVVSEGDPGDENA